MILACHEIGKTFGDNVIFSDASFQLEAHEKAALIGENGAGKTTLLKMITGMLAPDTGTVTIARGTSIGYLPQYQELDGDSTVYEEIRSSKADVLAMEQELRRLESEMKQAKGDALAGKMAAYNRLTETFEQQNGYALESEIVGVLKGLGFTEADFDKPISALSGGQKTRVALGKLLLTRPDILLLDEPTNHLDLSSIEWLQNYLINYTGCVLVVSHDRYFLDKVATKVLEIEKGTLHIYNGNYTDYAAKKQQIRDAQLKAYLNQQQEIRHQEEVIEKLRSFNREKSIKRANSREKMLDKMSQVEKPTEETSIHFRLKPRVTSGNDVLHVENLSKSYPPQTLFTDVSFDISRGEHVAIIGENGTGKTTFLNIINQSVSADSGSFRLGANVQIGYYDQEHHILHMEKTIFDEISDAYPKLTNTEIRNMLAAFLFTGDDVFKRISDLSGGERGRVSLAKLMLSKANFLILDEPTNHLDIPSREILEEALNDYTGTVLYVSHDRYFINQTAGRILELSNHTFTNYIGNYDYYLEKKEEQTNAEKTEKINDTGKAEAPTAAKTDWQAQKNAQAKERKRQNDLTRTEKEITKLEDESRRIDTEMTKEDVYTDAEKCRTLAEEKAQIQDELDKLYSQWETLSE